MVLEFQKLNKIGILKAIYILKMECYVESRLSIYHYKISFFWMIKGLNDLKKIDKKFEKIAYFVFDKRCREQYSIKLARFVPENLCP